MYNGYECTCPRKLNRENFEDWPSVKIGPHENFHYIVLHVSVPYQYEKKNFCGGQVIFFNTL